MPLSDMIARSRQLAKRWQGRRAAPKWIGLDLGSASIKLVEVEQHDGHVRVVNSLIQDLPAVEQASTGADRAGWLQAALKEFSSTRVHLAVGGSEAMIRRVRVPLMSRKELSQAVGWVVKDELPFPVQEAALDCQVVGEVWEKDIKKLDVLVAAVSLRAVREHLQLVQQAGATLASVVPAQIALWQGIHRCCPDRLAGSVAAVELGAEQTQIVIFKDAVPWVARTLPIGSRHLTQALVGVIASEQGEIQVDAARAEQLKRQYGIVPESADGVTEDGVPLGQLAALMRGVLETLLVELARFLDFYKMQMHEAGISGILLCGGGANLKRLRPFLEEGLGVPVELFDPLRNLAAADPGDFLLEHSGDSRLALAFGAAAGHGQEVDCTPPEVVAQRSKERAVGLLRTGGRVLSLLVALLYGGLQATAWWAGHERRSAERAWEALRPDYEQAVALAAGTARMEAILRTVDGLSQQQPVWDGALKELSQLVPGNIELTEFTATRIGPPPSGEVELRLKGTVWPQRAGGNAGLSALLEAMEESVFFRDVRLNSSQVQSSPAGSAWFEMQCRLE